MKTIEEAANEYVASKQFLDGGASEWVQNIFKAGVNFAQEWISIEDELPKREKNSYNILIKAEDKFEVVREIKNNIFNYEIEDLFLNGGYTHWKPIERI